MMFAEQTTEEVPVRRLHHPKACGVYRPSCVLMHEVHVSWSPMLGWTLYAPTVLHDGGAEGVRVTVKQCPWCGEKLR